MKNKYLQSFEDAQQTLVTANKSIVKPQVGDTVVVGIKIVEGVNSRVQSFEGYVIAIKNRGFATTITLRKLSDSKYGVERVVPLYAPNTEFVKVLSHNVVRRAKLYYLRDRVGKSAKLARKLLARKV